MRFLQGVSARVSDGVDMAKMKIEVLSARATAAGVSWRDRLVGHLPRYAPIASKFSFLLNLRDRLPGVAWASEKTLGLAADRPLPVWSSHPYQPAPSTPSAFPEATIFADCFNRYFEPDNLRAAETVLRATGLSLGQARPTTDDRRQRPLCCGRTYFSAGLVDAARDELSRTAAALRPVLEKGAPSSGSSRLACSPFETKRHVCSMTGLSNSANASCCSRSISRKSSTKASPRLSAQ